MTGAVRGGCGKERYSTRDSPMALEGERAAEQKGSGAVSPASAAKHATPLRCQEQHSHLQGAEGARLDSGARPRSREGAVGGWGGARPGRGGTSGAAAGPVSGDSGRLPAASD